MARNVEIKARLERLAPYLIRAEDLSSEPMQTIEQVDIFLNCDSGRLKLRILSPQYGELIFYKRPDQAGPKTSSYSVSKTAEPEKLRELLAQAYGVRAVVKKVRRFFLVGRTRIHIDTVEGLGNFLELEVVLGDSEDSATGVAEAEELMGKLQIDTSNLIEDAYVDLLSRAE